MRISLIGAQDEMAMEWANRDLLREVEERALWCGHAARDATSNRGSSTSGQGFRTLTTEVPATSSAPPRAPQMGQHTGGGLEVDQVLVVELFEGAPDVRAPFDMWVRWRGPPIPWRVWRPRGRAPTGPDCWPCALNCPAGRRERLPDAEAGHCHHRLCPPWPWRRCPVGGRELALSKRAGTW